MMFLNLGLSSALAGDIGWTLVHFLWQGLLLALLLQAILPLCRSAAARHNWALGTLAAMCLAPVITFLWLHADGGAAAASADANVAIAPGGAALAPVSVPWTGWLVGFWLAGVALLSLRALGGLVLAQGLRHSGLALPDDLLQRCRILQHRLAGYLPVQFLQSYRVTVPTVVGWLRPVILLPVAAIAGLTPQQLDALILHELAHIRRLDAFTNLLLMMAETILFYHPAIWLVSRRVRIEREHCCDDVAVAHCGSAAVYVEALASLETGRIVPVLALAANGGRLKDRAARLLGAPSDKSRFSLSAMAGVVLLSVVIGTVATAQNNAQVNKPDFAIRVVDESAGKNALQGPAGEDRMRVAQPGKDALWLKREGQIDGTALAEAHASMAKGEPVIQFRLTPKGAKQFADLSRANVGHRIAVVTGGTVIMDATVVEPMLGGKGQISGFNSEAEAKAYADKMMGTPAAPGPHASRQGAISGPVTLAAAPPSSVARVDDESISESELRQRVGLNIVTSGLPAPSAEDLKRIRTTSLEQLKDEAAERQDAAKNQITVGPGETDALIHRMLAQNRMTMEQLRMTLANANSSEEALRREIAANLAWQKVVRAVMAAQHPEQEIVDAAQIKRIADAELARAKAELHSGGDTASPP